FRVLRLLVLKTAKMLLHVRQRAEQSLFFAAPQRNANRPPRFYVQGRQNPNRLQHHRRTDAVVGSSRRVMPGVVMASEHDDFVFLVRAGNLPRASTGLPAALAARESGMGEGSSHRIATSIRLRNAASGPGSSPRPRPRAFPRTRSRRELCPSLNSDKHPALPGWAASA